MWMPSSPLGDGRLEVVIGHLVCRSCKGDKVWCNPVDVTIGDGLIVLVLLDIKLIQPQQTEVESLPQSLKTVQDG